MHESIDELKERFKGKTCVVVFSNQKLLDHEYGEWIDSHDVVFRVNWVEIDEKEKSVGTKTDMWFCGSKELTRKNYKNKNPRLKDAISFGWIEGSQYEMPQDMKDRLVTNAQMNLANGRKLTKTFYRLGGQPFLMSSGFLAVSMALDIFGQIDLVGQDMNEANGYVNMFTKKEQKPDVIHNFSFETRIYKKMLHEKRIREWPHI